MRLRRHARDRHRRRRGDPRRNPGEPRDTGRAAATTTPRVRASELVGRGWLNTGGRSLSLAELRGKIVLLDFWTFCCINCLHVIDELRPLEEKYPDVLVGRRGTSPPPVAA